MLHSFGSKANALVLRTLNDAASPVANVNDCGVAEAGSRSAAAPIWDPSASIKLTPGKPATVHIVAQGHVNNGGTCGPLDLFDGADKVVGRTRCNVCSGGGGAG